jgi:nitrogen fixation-related uncharacterized protein
MLVFVSVIVVVAAVLLFAQAIKNKDFNHADELSLLPLEEDENAKSNHLQ